MKQFLSPFISLFNRRMNFTRRLQYLAMVVTCGSLLAACGARSNPELQWARAALARNPQVKVLSVDSDQRLIKVRVVASGAIENISIDELAAIPIADLVALDNAAKSIATFASSSESPSASSTIAQTPTPSVTSTPPASPAPASSVVETPATSTYSEAPTSHEATQHETTQPTYTVEREDGRVHVSGPGISIESTPQPQRAADGRTPAHDDPIICDGKRFMHIDGRHLNVEGDAIVARGGCELHITNSTVKAGGTGVTVLDAIVHISNSTVQGGDSSLTASSASHVFLRDDKFIGLSRRNPQAEVKELGMNSWQ